jgi:hypothetical protein
LTGKLSITRQYVIHCTAICKQNLLTILFFDGCAFWISKMQFLKFQHFVCPTPPALSTGRARSGFNLFLKLAVVAFEQPVKRQVLIQIGPVKANRGNLDMIQLPVRASRQTGIFRNRKTNLPATFHADDNPAIHMRGGTSHVSQRLHAAF